MDCSPRMGESSPTSCEKQLNNLLRAEGRAWVLGLWPAALCWGMVDRKGRGTTVNPGKEFSKTMPPGSYFV